MESNRLLFVVESIYRIRGRGIVLLPGISLLEYSVARVGDRIVLKTPSDGEIRTTIEGIEYPPSVHIGPSENRRVGILLPKSITEAHVPVGTEVWRDVRATDPDASPFDS